MIDLSTTYLGMRFDSPILPSASPLSRSLDNLKRMEDAGAPAVVLNSLFEEQINAEGQELDRFLTYGAESYAEAQTYLPDQSAYCLTPDQYLSHIRKAKQALGIPVIASLNGVSTGGWIKYARKIEEAGADALELNVYYIPTDPALSSETIEEAYLDLLRDVKASIQIPVAVKLSAYFTNLARMADRLDEAGANALVLFNRFYQPDFDLETLEVVSRPNLSTRHTPQALRLPLTWIGILYGRIRADLAGSGGVHTAEDAIKLLMAGASVAMMASELLANGIEQIAEVRAAVVRWMETHEYESVEQMQGSMSQKSAAFPAAFARAHYMRAILDYDALRPAGVQPL